MNINELARAFVQGRPGKCHNAHTDGRTYVLHKSPIVVKTDTEYQFYWHGYYTKTTAAHMNEVLRAMAAPMRVSYADARRRGEDVFVVPIVKNCPQCGDDIDPRRYALGRRLCLPCGEDAARAERQSWTVAPMHKSNYMLLTNKEDLMGINNKGGLHR